MLCVATIQFLIRTPCQMPDDGSSQPVVSAQWDSSRVHLLACMKLQVSSRSQLGTIPNRACGVQAVGLNRQRPPVAAAATRSISIRPFPHRGSAIMGRRRALSKIGRRPRTDCCGALRFEVIEKSLGFELVEEFSSPLWSELGRRRPPRKQA